MARFEQTLKNLREIAALVKALKSTPQAPGKGAAQGGMSPQAVAAALAEALKSDNATTQAIAVRASNLSEKYPNKAY